MLGRGYIGQYDNGKPFVVKEASPEAAAALLAKLKARFAATNPAQVADEAFTAQDRYWGRLCLFRKGARIGGWTSVPEGEDPAALAASLAARLP
jgi:hypothetical protein